MKKFLLTCLILLGVSISAQITLGSGTSKGPAPVSTYYGYSYVQQIFPKSEINANAAGNITGLKFYLSPTATLTNSNEWVVYLGHTTKDSFTSTSDWIPVTELTQVFNGTVTNNAGVVEVTFSTPFPYNNTDNLVIAAEENKSSYDSNGSAEAMYVYTSSSNSALYYRSDTVNPDPAGTLPSGTQYGNKSIVTLLGLTPSTPPACPVVSAPVNGATDVSVLPSISWAASTGSTTYKISMGTTSGGTDIMNKVDVGNVTSYTLTSSLNFATQYYYTVYAVNAAGESTGCTEQSFTTATTLPCPSVSAPSSNQTGLPVRPTFTWASVTGASGYKLSLGTSAGANDLLNNFDLGNVTTYTLTQAQALLPSTQYYYTVTAYNGGVSSAGCTERNITTGAAASPANDDCTNAVALTVNPDLNCGTVTSGNTLGASLSMAATPCGGNPNDDVWYSFVATGSTHVVTLSNIVSTGTTTGITDMYFQVLSGSCGNLTSVLCSDPNSATITGLTAGQTYYVRVYTYSSTATANASFDICIGTPPPPPANDDCANAVALTVNPDLNCGTTTAGNTQSATQSMAATPCNGTPDDDVWYSFVATSPTHVVTLSNVSGSTDMYFQVLSGSCGTLTSVLCSDPNSATATGLTVGETYYVRVYTYGSGNNASFNICVGTPPPPPANDTCAGAIALTVGSDFAANAITGTNEGGTTDGTTTCQSNRVNNVWYTVVVPASGNVTLETKAAAASGFTDSVLSVYTGTCGSLTSVACDDDSGDDNFSLITLTGQTPGETLYVSVWRYGGGTGVDGQFQVSAYDASVLATSEVSNVKNNIKVYPNPFADVLNISDSSKVKNVLVTDVAGRLVKTIANPGSALYLGELKSGMYLVTLEMKDGSKQTIKAIKK